ncbi:MAG: exo-alpha-sialidase [Alphaproteobacteria bacterium]|nr:exo-alpha-sialidase [Alphaproteobacteria bacterium]MBV9061956.1 exo-alpha-sialidase [Alphaproteobacteria bacterium]
MSRSALGLRVALVTTAAVAALGAALATGAVAGQPQSIVRLERSPLSGGVLMARAIRSGAVRLPLVNRGAQHPALKCTPAPCTLPNVQASEGGSPVDEDPISIDPNNAKHILTAGNDYNCSSSLQGYFASTNGGKTFTHSCGTLAAGASGGDGDPVVAWDLKSVAYRGGIDSASNLEIVIGSSPDFGATWTTPVVAVASAGVDMDKPWLEIDTNASSPRKNTLYISNTEFFSNGDSQIGVSHSTDGGKTWALVNVSTRQVWPNSVDQFSDLAIGDDGTVYLTWQRCPVTGPTGDCGGTTAKMYFSKSVDGGVTWSKEKKIHSVHLVPDTCGAFYGCLPNTSERIANIPVVAIDNSTAQTHGRLYVMDYDWNGTYMQERVSSSGDGGATWSAPVAVTPNSDKHDQFFEWINVSPSGVLGATWLDRSLDPNNINYDAFAATSVDGGATFGTNYRLSTTSSNPFNDGFGSMFMGDYTGNAWDAGKPTLFMSWPDTRTGSATQDEIGGLRP